MLAPLPQWLAYLAADDVVPLEQVRHEVAERGSPQVAEVVLVRSARNALQSLDLLL